MSTRDRFHIGAAAFLLGAAAALMSPPAASQLLTWDPVTFIPTYMNALQTLESNINEATQIKNQLDQYRNMTQNTESLSPQDWQSASSDLQRLATLVQGGQSMSYSMQNLDASFRQRFPGYQAPTNSNQSFQALTDTSLDSIRTSLIAANAQSGQMDSESAVLANLRSAANGTQGQKAAIDAGNQIAIMQVEQTQKMRQLVMAQMQAQSAYMATETQSKAAEAASIKNATKYEDPTKINSQGLALPPAKSL